jgi:hypothetical protein
MQQENKINSSIVNTSVADDNRLRGYIKFACARATKSHLNRFKEAPQLYKIFLSGQAEKALKLGPSLEMGFSFQEKRVILYTSKEGTADVKVSYITCEVIPTQEVQGAQTVLYLEEPKEIGKLCIIK